MSVGSTFRYTQNEFHLFVVRTPTSDLIVDFCHCREDPTSLADYIQAWLASGHGVRACQGNFERFLIAFAGIVDEWLRHPDDFLDYLEEIGDDDIRRHPRSVSKLFRDKDTERRVLDRDFFDRCVFATLHDPDSL